MTWLHIAIELGFAVAGAIGLTIAVHQMRIAASHDTWNRDL